MALLAGFAGTCDGSIGLVDAGAANLPPLCWPPLSLLLFTADAAPRFGITLDMPALLWVLDCHIFDKDIALPVPAWLVLLEVGKSGLCREIGVRLV